jgi:hypothetical protein
MAVCTYNAGADRIMECALSTTALDLRCAYVTAVGGAGDIAAMINQDIDTVAAVDALTGLGISAQRVALTGETSTEDDTNNRANVDAADVVFTPVAESAWGHIIYDEGGGADATRTLIKGQSYASAQPVNGGLTLTIADFLRVNTATA